MNATRRHMIQGGLFGAGLIGLRSLATGLPISFLLRPSTALAEETACADRQRAQYLILSTSDAGDPVNSNVPGTYEFPDIVHPQDPQMVPVPIALGDKVYMAASPWKILPEWALARTCFFHHATLTNNHPNLPKVLKAMGATARQEMLPSIFAKALRPCLGTVQTEPISVGAGEVLTYEGRGLPNLNPTGLRDVLTKPTGPLSRLQQLRDQSLDRMHALLKERGTSAQRAYLDRLARSRAEARAISDQLLDNLAAITNDQAEGQIIAAATLIKMNVAPVVAIRIPFGGDNHADPDLARETAETVSGVQRIGLLLEKLREYQLQDQVTFVMLNVFGRTLKKLGTAGRDHWASHHCSILIGKHIRPGVVGGLEPQIGDYYALPIDSKTGRGTPDGDIPFAETLSAVAKTIGAALGVPQAVLDQQIAKGKVVHAALA
ncbi:MAG: DUF1501 domain-containing protein [Myxococcales bacterium]|nr:DUF1501 domain-containing protein [Myxococcales bacterium]